MVWQFFRWIFFRIPPEMAHSVVLFFLKITNKVAFSFPYYLRGEKKYEYFNRAFHSPLGLAAGFDKNGELLPSMMALGFGFVEIGTVTPLPQGGNPKPRLFRLKESEGLINRMGFNNEGMGVVAQRLERLGSRACPIGINIGKNKDTPLEKAHLDYVLLIERLYRYADFFVVNISSPNTPGLRDLQEENFLRPLLRSIGSKIRECGQGNAPSFLLKISPDMGDSLEQTIDIAMESGCGGIVATNTSTRRDLPIQRDAVDFSQESGGISGRPLRELSVSHIEKLRRQMGPKPLLISVGGLSDGEDAKARLEAGANLLELYTGLIYRGPGLVREINKSLKTCF